MAASAFAVHVSLSSAAAAVAGGTTAASGLRSRPSSREAAADAGPWGDQGDDIGSSDLDLDLGPETLQELEALKAMWSCPMYSGGVYEDAADLALSDTGEAVQQLINQAENVSLEPVREVHGRLHLNSRCADLWGLLAFVSGTLCIYHSYNCVGFIYRFYY
jgi:hypothetical protein